MKRYAASVVSSFFVFVACSLLFVVAMLPATSAFAVDVVAEPSGNWLTALLGAAPDWLQGLSLIIAGAASIAALTPTPKDDGILSVLRKVIDLLALNILGAKNEQLDKTDKYLR